jgi:hypothetical protein
VVVHSVVKFQIHFMSRVHNFHSLMLANKGMDSELCERQFALKCYVKFQRSFPDSFISCAGFGIPLIMTNKILPKFKTLVLYYFMSL